MNVKDISTVKYLQRVNTYSFENILWNITVILLFFKEINPQLQPKILLFQFWNLLMEFKNTKEWEDKFSLARNTYNSMILKIKTLKNKNSTLILKFPAGTSLK